MSIPKNLAAAFMPHGESRRSTATLAAVNAELVHDVDGDNAATIFINGTGTFNATYSVQGSPDGANFFDVLAFPHAPASLGGTLPLPGQPLVAETVNGAIVNRLLCVAVGGLRKLRIRLTAHSSGSADVTINSDACDSLSPYVRDQRASTLMVTVTAAVNIAATLTLPAVAGLRHYVDFVKVTRSATAALATSATPVLVTTTNLPGLPVLTFGSDAGGVGVDKEQVLDFGGAGCAGLLVNTATTVVCPAYTGVIWRITAAYRLGL